MNNVWVVISEEPDDAEDVQGVASSIDGVLEIVRNATPGHIMSDIVVNARYSDELTVLALENGEHMRSWRIESHPLTAASESGTLQR